MKPVRLAAAATTILPRWGLISLCLLYMVPGILRRDPWRTDDAAGFGIMWTMAHGSLSDWLAPNIAGLAMPQEGPLAFWLGAILIKLFGWLTGDALAARFSTLLFFAIGAVAIWRTVYVLGRRQEAQPLKLAFGGQPAPRDYGRTLADGALLIYIACLGLLLRSHETAAPALQVSLVAASLYAGTCLFDAKTWRSAIGLGFSLGCLVLTRGWIVPVALYASLIVLAFWRERQLVSKLLLSLLIAGLLPLCWIMLHEWQQPAPGFIAEWLQWHQTQIAKTGLHTFALLTKSLIWFAWPAWPIAFWAMYAWRRQHVLHIQLPAIALFGVLITCVFSNLAGNADLLPLLPPLVMLAAFGLPTFKRGGINAIDWFSVMTLTAIAAFIWLGWIAKQTGWPAQLAKNAFRLAPGFKPEFNFLAFAVALAATIGWGLLLQWRLARKPPVLWRAVVLSTGGVVLCWLLLMTLWLPWLNYGKSYATVAEQIQSTLPVNYDCVTADGIGPAQRASFAYLGEVKFAKKNQKHCDYLLVQDNDVRHKHSDAIKKISADYTLLWQGRRASDRDESFRLFARKSP